MLIHALCLFSSLWLLSAIIMSIVNVRFFGRSFLYHFRYNILFWWIMVYLMFSGLYGDYLESLNELKNSNDGMKACDKKVGGK